MNAPVCPVTKSQTPSRMAPTLLPSIPIATDLPSLIRSVNIIRDILRNITTSLTVNNTYLSRGAPPPKIPPKTSYLMSPYPDWEQVSHTIDTGFVWRKSGPDQKDNTQRACVTRTFQVEFRNNQRDSDKSFYWRVKKPLDQSGGTSKAPPFKEDFFERVINVKWGTGGFNFAGNISFTDITPPTEFAIGQATPHFTWLGGNSSDGTEWKSSREEEGLALFCCVSGKVGNETITIAAGDVLDGPHDFDPGYSIHWGVVPGAGISYDGGQTWKDADLPKQESILRPPDPMTGRGADSAGGNANSVAYHPGTQTFYVGATVFFIVGRDMYWEDRLYKWSGGGFSEEYSERREVFDPFKGYRWPQGGTALKERLLIADGTGRTSAGPTTLLAVSFRSNQRMGYTTTGGGRTYLSVNGDDTGITLGGTEITVPGMAVVNSVCGGKGHIVAVGWEDEDELRGPVTFVSNDDGRSWKPALTEHINDNPTIDDKDGGSSSGSCSFCP